MELSGFYYLPYFVFCIRKNSRNLGGSTIEINISIFFFDSVETDIESFYNTVQHNEQNCYADHFAVGLEDEAYDSADEDENANERDEDSEPNLFHFLSFYFRIKPYKIQEFLGEIKKEYSDLKREDPLNYKKILASIEWFLKNFLSRGNIENKAKWKINLVTKDGTEIKLIIHLNLESNLNCYNQKGRNILHEACHQYSALKIRMLLNHCNEEQINKRCKIYNLLPLYYSLENVDVWKDMDIVKLFLEKGAEVYHPTQNIKIETDSDLDKYLEFVAHRFKFWNDIQDKQCELERLIILPKNILKDLVNDKDIHGDTPLHHVTFDERGKEFIEWLIENNANVNAKNHDDATPLLNAAHRNEGDVVELLLKSGAIVDVTCVSGKTPLHFTKSYEVFDILLSNGADINKEDINGDPQMNVESLIQERHTDFFKKVREYFCYLEHFKKYIHPKYESILEDSQSEECRKNFESDLEILKTIKITSNYSIFDLLYLKDRNNVYLNQEIVKNLITINIEKINLPRVYLRKPLRENISEILIFNEAFLLLPSSPGLFLHLPYLCNRRIFNFLDLNNAIKLIEAFR